MTERYETLDGGRLTVHRDFTRLLRRRGLDVFENFYDERMGRLLRDVGPRANLRVTLDAEGGAVTGFLKRHEPLSLAERLAAWLRLRSPKTAARREWENIERLAGLGIATMQPIALGEDRRSGRSFLLTAEIGSATTEITSPGIASFGTTDSTKKIPVRIQVDWGALQDTSPVPGMTADVVIRIK
jgi:hypothetical protein